MSCNHCSTKFNFFHKEMGCANCGLAFCSKCLKQKCNIPSKGGGEYHVCRTCHAKLKSGTNTNSAKVIYPPDIFLKRLESLENPAAPPIIMYKQDSRIAALKTGLSPADQELVDRLEKLKEDGKGPPPSENEIRKRLADLKGYKYSEQSSNKPLYVPDTRTDVEKVDSLLEQYSSEHGIELTHNPHEDIEDRLATLKGQEQKSSENSSKNDLNDDYNSEEEVERITRKIKDQVALEERVPIKLSSEEDEFPERTSPELPWCVLCNGDAKFRCMDCGGDLYCSQCNIEVHKDWGDTDHQVVPYRPQ